MDDSRRMTSIITAQPARSSTALPVNTRVPLSRAPSRANVIMCPTRTPSASVSSLLVVPRSTASSLSLNGFSRSAASSRWLGLAPEMPSTGPSSPWMIRCWSTTMRSSW